MSEAFDRWRMEEGVEDLIDSVNRLAATGLASLCSSHLIKETINTLGRSSFTMRATFLVQ